MGLDSFPDWTGQAPSRPQESQIERSTTCEITQDFCIDGTETQRRLVESQSSPSRRDLRGILSAADDALGLCDHSLASAVKGERGMSLRAVASSETYSFPKCSFQAKPHSISLAGA